MIPKGYRLLSEDPSAAVTAKAVQLLSQNYGYSEENNIDGKDLLFVVEEHSWYGANPDLPPTPHKGVTVYERVDTESNNESSTEARLTNPAGALLPLFATIGLVGAAYKLLRRKGRR